MKVENDEREKFVGPRKMWDEDRKLVYSWIYVNYKKNPNNSNSSISILPTKHSNLPLVRPEGLEWRSFYEF